GGPTDVFARPIAQRLTEQLRKQFYVENIAGANTNVGTSQAAKALPDGHTMLVTTNNLVVNPTYFNNVSFDPLKDFDPVTLSVISPFLVGVNPFVPAKTVKELVALIKANPGKYNFTGPERARPRTSWANSSARRSASTSSTFPTTAEARRSPQWSRATPQSL